ncbi:phosphatidylglycerol lysyltransferase domain-containing protein [Geomonas sp. RF6]|uniref:DUF2156 domain-containing protein n=1 Tax=Geomonas sp. RF6 TaxID=2897342 RepID=UPI001E4F1B63|nr:phosphatidylglycerol lysyltransferase domain-containing protein [Geomonas sp. RF6]UFS69629.1 phosphatidylglycerol lysyltransferase domain-containing protein [Geomonas sp. RF6]
MEIPRYPVSRPLDLEDKPLLDRIFREMQPRISEFTFANLYLFRTVHAYKITALGDAIVILGRGYDGTEYFLPPLGTVEDALDRLLSEGMTLYGAGDPFVERFLQGKDVVIAEDRDSFDYLHLREELATLPGQRYHKKKNRVNYFAARNRYTTEIYEPRHRDLCLELLEEWLRVRTELSDSMIGEAEGTAEALKMSEELGLSGIVVLVEGRVKGFALGEALNAETAVCHFEKGDVFMEGVYQLVNREFARLLFTGMRYVNREQDLGQESLRSAKLSYHPYELVKKYRVTKKG